MLLSRLTTTLPGALAGGLVGWALVGLASLTGGLGVLEAVFVLGCAALALCARGLGMSLAAVLFGGLAAGFGRAGGGPLGAVVVVLGCGIVGGWLAWPAATKRTPRPRQARRVLWWEDRRFGLS
jgi:hypothetical protein